MQCIVFLCFVLKEQYSVKCGDLAYVHANKVTCVHNAETQFKQRLNWGFLDCMQIRYEACEVYKPNN